MPPDRPDAAFVRLLLLGPFEVRRGEAVQNLPKKAQGLIAYLAARPGERHSRDHLATLLWGNTASEQARQSLRQCLMALRNAFGRGSEHLVVADTASVMLKPGTSVSSDLEEFDALCRSSRVEDIERACALYRDELLSGLHIPVEPFDDWVSLQRQRLALARAEALLKSAQMRAERGDAAEAISASRNLTAYDPLREEGHRLLMRLLGASGQRSAALKQYETLTKLLHEHLGIAPDVETTTLATAYPLNSGAVSCDMSTNQEWCHDTREPQRLVA